MSTGRDNASRSSSSSFSSSSSSSSNQQSKEECWRMLHTAQHHAKAAVTYEQQGERLRAAISFNHAANAIFRALEIYPACPNSDDYKVKGQQYIESSNRLGFDPTATSYAAPPPNPKSKEERRGTATYWDGVRLQEDGKYSLAQQKYTEAASLLLKALPHVTAPVDVVRIKQLCNKAISSAERLKGRFTSDGKEPVDTLPPLKQEGAQQKTTRTNTASPTKQAPSRKEPKDLRAKGSLSKEELDVLLYTSKVNGLVYVPWSDDDASDDFTNVKTLFKDPAGKMALTPAQKAISEWKRPSQFMKKPTVVAELDEENIKQTIIPDCSFISSLAISASYERKTGTPLLIHNIFPQKDGKPIYNPYGKYAVRLHFNGCWRKVLIDDFFPVSSLGDLQCSFSKNKNELWVSIFEKAYMKVMGGYNFPGSNSAIDLHALTGWIPDRVPIKKCDGKMWELLWRGLHTGQCLMTVATGPLNDRDSERAGLVPTHAYAIVDMRRAGEKSMLKLKNPWAHKRWKGNYSPTDSRLWTPDMKKILQYDPDRAIQDDDGTFWIDWKSVQRYFEIIYINWDPSRFSFGTTYHRCWDQGDGPVKDLYNMEYNPQYSLSVDAATDGSVWLLLSRHITRLSDFANNEEFITLHVYRGGKQVFMPENPLVQGVKINSPHYLCKLDVKAGKKYTVIVSQYERANTIRFSLKSFGDVAHTLKPISHPYPKAVQIKSEWAFHTAGGSQNNREAFKKNPRYLLETPTGEGPYSVLLKLQAPRQYSVGITVTDMAGQPVCDSGDYRRGFTCIQAPLKRGSKYMVIPATYLEGQHGRFFLTVAASEQLVLKKIASRQ